MSELLFNGDCLNIMKDIPDNSVDAIVSDPPYGLSFMNKHWDYDIPSIEVWKEALRVLKPGGHLLSFGGTRTYHRLVVNIEDAGFEIRDMISWLYGQGFPKSTNVLKSGLKQGLFCDCKEAESNTESHLRSMRDSDLSSEVSNSTTSGEVLQSSMSEQGSQKTMLRTESEESFTSREESGMEGRGDIQTEQGKLHRSEVCPVSREVQSNVEKRQLRDGTSLNNGESFGAHSNSDRSHPSQGPQYSEQSHNEFRVIPQQSRPQTCGSCGKAVCYPGLGSALKPSVEPICVARKPLEKGLTVAQNVMKWGTGAINIDASRIGYASEQDAKEGRSARASTSKGMEFFTEKGHDQFNRSDRSAIQGRWPANILFDEAAAAMLDEQSGNRRGFSSGGAKGAGYRSEYVNGDSKNKTLPAQTYNDLGGASRFFYVAKASKRERSEGNIHPTVKPIKLMEYLIKLVTPPKGTVLDPFMGSGSTGVAAKNLNFDFIGIELDQNYFERADKRLLSTKATRQQNAQ